MLGVGSSRVQGMQPNMSSLPAAATLKASCQAPTFSLSGMAKGSAPRPSASRGTCLGRSGRHAVCDWGLGATAASEHRTIPTAAAHASFPACRSQNRSLTHPVVLDKVLEVDCRRLPHLHRHRLERDQLGGGRQGGRAAEGRLQQHNSLRCQSNVAESNPTNWAAQGPLPARPGRKAAGGNRRRRRAAPPHLEHMQAVDGLLAGLFQVRGGRLDLLLGQGRRGAAASVGCSGGLAASC